VLSPASRNVASRDSSSVLPVRCTAPVGARHGKKSDRPSRTAAARRRSHGRIFQKRRSYLATARQLLSRKVWPNLSPGTGRLHTSRIRLCARGKSGRSATACQRRLSETEALRNPGDRFPRIDLRLVESLPARARLPLLRICYSVYYLPRSGNCGQRPATRGHSFPLD
jgi:hypothetical protein